MRSSKVDKRNGALCTQREHALARRQKEYVINSVKGEKKRDKTAKKSRRMLRFVRAVSLSLSLRDDVANLLTLPVAISDCNRNRILCEKTKMDYFLKINVA